MPAGWRRYGWGREDRVCVRKSRVDVCEQSSTRSGRRAAERQQDHRHGRRRRERMPSISRLSREDAVIDLTAVVKVLRDHGAVIPRSAVDVHVIEAGVNASARRAEYDGG